jgi:hypothetical protein
LEEIFYCQKYSPQYTMFWKQTASSSGEQGSNLLPKFGSMLSIFMTMEKVLVNAAGITQEGPFMMK